MRFLDDERLYTEYAYFERHFRWSNQAVPTNALKYHCYWTGIMSQHHILSLKSLLVSQSPPYEVWVWMSASDLERNEALIRAFGTARSVTFCEYDLEREVLGTPYEKYCQLWRSALVGTPAEKSDAFRTLILAKYGSLYFDLDVLCLRDLRPLCNVEFCYEWSNRPYANTAVMHAFENSANMGPLIERGARIGSLHPARLFRFAEPNASNDFLVFPSFLFDPLWISSDLKVKQNAYCGTIEDFFVSEAAVALHDFFPASYAYHWHNQWERSIRPETVIGQLYDEISARYAKMFQVE